MDTPYRQIPVKDLKPHPGNPRKISKVQLEQLKDSLTRNPELFQARPLIVTPDFFILAGNQRHRACQQLGYDTVPCLVVDLPEDKQKELMIRDNVQNGEWDWDILQEDWQLDELQQWGVEVPEFVTKKKRRKTQEDSFTEAPHTNITALGEIYELISSDVRHKVIVGDATDPNTLHRLCGEVRIDAVFTDPPYNVNYSGRGKKTSNTIKNDNMVRSDFRLFLDAVFVNYIAFAKPGCPFYVCHSSSSQRDFEDAMEAAGLKVKNQIIWNKLVASMGWGNYRWKHEPLLYATLAGKDVQFYGDRKQYTVWDQELTPELAMQIVTKLRDQDEKGSSTVWKLNRDQNYEHPTQKPLQLIEISLHNSTKEGDVVCDLFSGSGSTLIACEQLSRSCYTAELDPRYADVTIARYIRWKRMQNEEFSLLKNGEPIPDHMFDVAIG